MAPMMPSSHKGLVGTGVAAVGGVGATGVALTALGRGSGNALTQSLTLVLLMSFTAHPGV